MNIKFTHYKYFHILICSILVTFFLLFSSLPVSACGTTHQSLEVPSEIANGTYMAAGSSYRPAPLWWDISPEFTASENGYYVFLLESFVYEMSASGYCYSCEASAVYMQAGSMPSSIPGSSGGVWELITVLSASHSETYTGDCGGEGYDSSSYKRTEYVYKFNPCVDKDKDNHYAISGSCAQSDDCNDNDPMVYQGCECSSGDTLICPYSGPAGTLGIGVCKAGIKTCRHSKWSACEGEVLPSANQGCECDNGDVQICPYSGPEGTAGISFCKAGTKTCIQGRWGVCTGEVLPKDEICDDKIDNNCNGLTDEGCDCKDSDKECCKDLMKIGSTVNMATGNLSHSQPLYRTLKAILPIDLSLLYNSTSGDGPLGLGWSHSYGMSVYQGDNGVYIYNSAGTRKTALYPAGAQYKPRSSEYPALTVNPDGTYTLKRDRDITYSFDPSGRLAGIQDRFSNTVTFTYDASHLTGITDSQGRSISLLYNSDNRIETITDPNNNIHSFIYENNNLVNVSTLTTDMQTLTWAYTYTADGRMLTKTTPMDQTITYAYHNNRLTQVTDNEGRTRSMSFDPSTGASGIAARNDGQWIYSYDPATGKLSSKTDPEGYITSYAYGANTETVTDAKGNITEYVYDSNQNLLSMTEKSATDPLGRVTVYTYNTDNEILSVTDPENHVTTYTYEMDNGEKIVRIKDPANEETEMRYYADGRIKSIKNPLNQMTSFTYSFDRVTKQTTEIMADFLGTGTSRIYDLSGNMIESWDAFGTVTKYEYNSLNQLKTVKDYEGRVMSAYEYQADGNLQTVTDANGNSTYYRYNYDGKITETKDALGNTTTYVFGGGTGCATCGGSKDDLVSVTDANNKTTYYEYYKNNLKKNQKDPLNHITAYTYDATGFMTSLTDLAQAVTAFDKTDLVMTKTDPLGSVTTYVYDKAGRLKTKTDRKGDTINYSYTPDNILEAITYPDSSSVTFTNDELDRTTVMTDSLGTTAYLYDDANRTVTVTDPHGFVVVYRNDEAGRLKELTYPGNKKVIYGYDRLNRMETARLDWLNQTATYQYDAAGRLTSLTNFNGTVTTYGYDAANRLTRLENKKSDDSVIASYSFPVLDGIGNRMKVVKKEPFVTVLTPEQSTYTYNDKKNRIETAGTDNFTHDNEGQLATGYGNAFAFDYEHRLVTANGTQYFYDGKGNRLKAVRNGVTTKYVYDNRSNLLAEADGSNNITRYYVHGLGLIAAISPSDEVYNYHYNAIGSTIAITDQSQNIVNKYAYDSFGKVLNQVEALPQPFKYVGQYGVMAEPNGFYYMRARYYDPKVGRFVSEDPIGFEGGTVNLYEYVGNNPVKFIDPLGLEWVNPIVYWRNLYNYARSERTWGHQQYPGEANSSIRHCVVSCMVASNFGSAGARVAGVGNEAQGLVLHDIPDLRGRLSGERPWAFQWQDLMDNERGFQAAKKNCSNMSESDTRQSCIQRCQEQ